MQPPPCGRSRARKRRHVAHCQKPPSGCGCSPSPPRHLHLRVAVRSPLGLVPGPERGRPHVDAPRAARPNPAVGRAGPPSRRDAREVRRAARPSGAACPSRLTCTCLPSCSVRGREAGVITVWNTSNTSGGSPCPDTLNPLAMGMATSWCRARRYAHIKHQHIELILQPTNMRLRSVSLLRVEARAQSCHPWTT